MNKIDPKPLAGYEQDFALWSAEQAAHIRAGKFDRVDRQNVAEELEDLGNSQRDQIESRLAVLLAHLLKWEFQPAARIPSWKATIVEQRWRICRVISKNPSLKRYPAEVLDDEYSIAMTLAEADTNLPVSSFPAKSPYSVQQVLDDAFWPGGTDMPTKTPAKRSGKY